MLATEIKVPLFLFEVLPILIEMCLHVLLELLILGSQLLVMLDGSSMLRADCFKFLTQRLVASLQRGYILMAVHHHNLYRLIMLKLPSTTLTRLTWHTLALLSRRRKDSHWIYSSQSEEMTHARLGSITLSVLPPHPLDSTLRLHRAIENAHVILSPQPSLTLSFLKRLGQKKLQEETNDSSISVYESEAANLVKWQGKEKGTIDESLELSKQLQMAEQTEKISQSNNDRQNRQLKAQQEKLIEFMEISSFKNELQTFKSRNSGWPKVQSLPNNIMNLTNWRKGGIDVLCLLSELDHLGSQSIFNYLQSEKMPYEILPTPNSIINTLAASGFPADRFAIQYFPSSLETLFSTRASMKMAIAIVISSQHFQKCLEHIVKAYGQPHLIYIENEAGEVVGRGEVGSLMYEVSNDLQGGIYRLVVAPYLSKFNEDLKQEKSKVSRLYGEAMHQNTHEVRMQFITEQLYSLQQQKDPKSVLLHSLLEKMVLKKMPEDSIASIAGEITGVSKEQILQLIREVREGIEVDYIGLAELGKTK